MKLTTVQTVTVQPATAAVTNQIDTVCAKFVDDGTTITATEVQVSNSTVTPSFPRRIANQVLYSATTSPVYAGLAAQTNAENYARLLVVLGLTA